VSLRLQINLLITAIMLLVVAGVVYLEMDHARRQVKEETDASTRVARQLLGHVAMTYEEADLRFLAVFLQRLGRVRGNEIMLFDADGNMLYHSPPSPYKAGRDAPAWYSALIAPRVETMTMAVAQGKLVIEPNSSRSVLDSWDDVRWLLAVAGMLFVAVNAVVFWVTGRALKPLQEVVHGLERLGQGDYATRLAPMRGREVRLISDTFNRMAQAVEESITLKRDARRTAQQLADNRELTHMIQAGIEEERRMIARELHDEIGQSVTAIKSLALSIAQRTQGKDEPTARTARLVVDTAGRIYDVMHHIIPRLRPLALDNLGLGDALADLANDWRMHHPNVEFALDAASLPADLGDTVKISAYRIVQEGVTNAIRHARPHRITVRVWTEEGMLRISVSDDGKGLASDWDRPGHFGLRGMRERAQALGGELTLENLAEGGLRVSARLPMA
jgi:two-component system sensor histidine kinase UhpB